MDFSFFQNSENLLFLLFCALFVATLGFSAWLVIYKTGSIFWKTTKEKKSYVKESVKEPVIKKQLGLKGGNLKITPLQNNEEAAEQKDGQKIEEGLAALKDMAKGESPEEKSFLESQQNIKIPRPKKKENDAVKEIQEIQTSPVLEKEIIKSAEIKLPGQIKEEAVLKTQPLPKDFSSQVYEKFSGSKTSLPKDSIFGGKDAINRRLLKFKLKMAKGDSLKEMIKVQRQIGLRITREEREKLVEKYFPKYYGQEISKKEISKQMRIVERTPVKTAGERIQRRKEIAFLRKIGGVK